MDTDTMQKVGGIALIVGSLLLTAYSIAFPLLLPIHGDTYDLAAMVRDPYWLWIATTSFIGVILMLIGFAAVYARMRADAGRVGLIGFLFVEAAYLLQACKVSWELFLYPVIAANDQSAFLLREGIIKHDVMVVAFKAIASTTIFLGIILFCLALYRSREFPKAAAILIAGGAFVYALGPMLSVLIAIAGIFTLSMGCLVLGLTLARQQTA